MKDLFKKIIRGGEGILLLLVCSIIALPFLVVLVPVKLFKKQSFDATAFIVDIAESFDAFAISFKEAIREF